MTAMMKYTILALAALAATAQAFKDTSPFLIVSSSPLPKLDSSTGGLGLRAELLESTRSVLSHCTTDLYILISQPSMGIRDIAHSPFLRSMVEQRKAGNSGIVMREVLGFEGTEGEDLVRFIQQKCGAVRSKSLPKTMGEGVGRLAVVKELPALSGGLEEREKMVRDNDVVLQQTLSKIPQGKSFTLLFLSTAPPSSVPVSSHSTSTSENDVQYQPSFENDAVHMDLKRNLAPDRGSGPYSDLRPLFEQYTFFNPGLFMGLLVGLVLIAILGVGMRALGSLMVSYGAFDKEMGPAAQKKTQ